MSARLDMAVILAGGAGSRMRAGAETGGLTEGQRAAAETGVKGMIPIGRPFLDYVIHGLAEAGVRRVCLVIGKGHGMVREYYEKVARERVEILFAEQAAPRGTADALLAAEDVVERAGAERFIVINSDNFYPVEAYLKLAEMEGAGTVGFERAGLVAGGIAAERIGKFAILQVGAGGWLERVVEKPTEDQMREVRGPVLVSMNCWVFKKSVFGACRGIGVSARGELELTDGVNELVRRGEKVKVEAVRGVVLDLSSRGDIAGVAEKLAGMEVRL